MDKSTALNRELSVVSRRALEATAILWVILAIVSYESDLSLNTVVLLAISIALSLLPVVFVSKLNLINVLSSRQSRKLTSQIDKAYSVDSLSQVSSILIDQAKLIDSTPPTPAEFIIGRQTYSISDTGSGQYGHIQNQHGHNLTSKLSEDVKLFLEACHATATLTSKTDHSQDFSKSQYEVISDKPEGLLVSKRSTKHLVVFVRTSLATALDKSSEIWDHGHVRPLTPADREHFIESDQAQATNLSSDVCLGIRDIASQDKY